jgi:5'-phosphate synthase pdxT subunit
MAAGAARGLPSGPPAGHRPQHDRLGPVAVLALQGDFAAHARALSARGVEAVEARAAAQLGGVAGVVLPGGESTTMLRLLREIGLEDGLRRLVEDGVPTLATCAGVILLAREVRHPAQPSLGVLDVVVERNAYGRQIDSAVVGLDVDDPAALGAERLEGVFIRAPKLIEVGPGVEVLARRAGSPVLVRQGAILAATFHPELSPNSPVIDLFTRQLGGGP